jgi:hypothetical protein
LTGNAGHGKALVCRNPEVRLTRDWMAMHDLKWSASEKKIARRAYEAAAESMLARVMADFKARAAAVATPSEMWAIEVDLRQQRRKIEEMLDYRYSQLPLVFARLIGEGHLDEAQLSGLSEEKLEIIGRFLTWMRRES